VSAPPPGLVRTLQQALALHREGRLDDAERFYREVLRQAPSQPDALHFLGVLEGQRGRNDSALALMDRSIGANPRQPAVLYNRANLLREMGQFEKALSGYDAALAIKSDNFAALNNRGAVLEQLGRHEEAIAAFDRVLALKPDHADAYVNRGNALVALARYEQALAAYDRALALTPANVAALYGRGNALTKLSRGDDALAAYDRALQLGGENSDVLSNRGSLLGRLNRVDEALQSFARATAATPNHAETYNNRAVLFMQISRFEEALRDYDRALALKPHYEESLYGRGSALIELNRHNEAIETLQELLRRNPDYPYGLGMLVHAQNTACDWRDSSAQTAMIEAIRAGKRAASPLALLAVSDSPSDKLLCSQILMRDKFNAPQSTPAPRAHGHERIRVGYLSADLRTHPVAMLMAGVFEHHDPLHFETVAFSYGADDASPMRARLSRSFDRFLDVRAMSDTEVASLARQNEVDILVDLTGLTASARPGIFALRPALVQVNYLGFAGTMGAGFVDYIIADPVVIPNAHHAFYTEKVAYLPYCYLPHDSARRIAAEMTSRTQAGLPERGFVFASFNNSYKFSTAMFDIWMRLLETVDGSVLWLSQPNPAAMHNLRREAEARGVDPDRLVFAPRLPAPEDHLARLSLADLFLDTLPYNAHTTAMDALWAGLPVLTLMGDSFASRVAASQLHAVGLPELAVDSLQAYQAKALTLARDPHAMSKLKAKLAANRGQCALFDTARFTRNLERAYRTMWLRAERGQPAETFHVEETSRP